MDKVLNFGKWLRETRTQQSLTIQNLVEQSGVNAATISKIENGLTQPTLGTAINICKGLGATVEDFVQVLQGIESPTGSELSENPFSGKNTLTIEDVKAFLELFDGNEERGREILANIMTIASIRLDSEERGKNKSTTEVPPIVPSDIEKLLFSSRIYHFNINYPYEISPATIMEIYRQNGVMILADIWTHLDEVSRERLDEIKRSDHRIANLVNLARIKWVGRVRLADLVLLDDELGKGGDILRLSWRVCVDDEITAFLSEKWAPDLQASPFDRQLIEKMKKSVNLLVTLSRWLQHSNWEDVSWLDYLRNAVTASTSLIHSVDNDDESGALPRTEQPKAGNQDLLAEAHAGTTQNIRIEAYAGTIQNILIQTSEGKVLKLAEIEAPKPTYREGAGEGSKHELVALESRRYEDALAAFEQILHLDPADIDANYGKAATLKLLGRAEEAQRTYEKALQLKRGVRKRLQRIQATVEREEPL